MAGFRLHDAKASGIVKSERGLVADEYPGRCLAVDSGQRMLQEPATESGAVAGRVNVKPGQFILVYGAEAD